MPRQRTGRGSSEKPARIAAKIHVASLEYDHADEEDDKDISRHVNSVQMGDVQLLLAPCQKPTRRFAADPKTRREDKNRLGRPLNPPAYGSLRQDDGGDIGCRLQP